MFSDAELFEMFNVDLTPYSPDDELPPDSRTVEGETYYPNRGVNKETVWLWSVNRQHAHKNKIKREKNKREDYAVPALRIGQPGSEDRIEAYRRFYASQLGEDGASAFNIPDGEVEDHEIIDTRPANVFDGI